jgi:predicted  nucleic acid-binding Zn-ribbon protein
MNTQRLLQDLLKLQALEFDEVKEPEKEDRVAELRVRIPSPILGHYDRMRVRGKKGVRAVRNQICLGCHMQVTRATVINLMHGEDIQVCESCGAYLYLPSPEEAEAAPAPAPEAKPARKSAAKPRKSRVVSYAA